MMKRKLTTLTALTLIAGCGAAAAQDAVPIRYLRPMRNTVSVGARLTTSGANVKFSNLGNIDSGRFVIDETAGGFNKGGGRQYHNGLVVGDPNTDAKFVLDATGTTAKDTTEPLQVVNGRYNRVVIVNKYQRDAKNYIIYTNKAGQVVARNADGTLPTVPAGDAYTAQLQKDAAGNTVTERLTTGDYVAYNDFYTRRWQVNGADQYVKDGQGRIVGVNMDLFGTTSNGATAEAESGAGVGFEIALERTIRRQSLRFEWGVKATVGLSSINAKDAGTITANLTRTRDTYMLNPAFGALPADYPSSVNRVYRYGPKQYPDDPSGREIEFTNPLSVIPVKQPDGSYSQFIEQAGAATIDGQWQIKGAYYVAKFGPSARYYFSPRFSVSASAGVAVAYVTTRYYIDETLRMTGLNSTADVSLRTSELRDASDPLRPFDNTRKQVEIGPVGEVNFEWWLTPSTGFYGGVTYEKIGNYSHTVLNHSAEIDLGQGAVWRFGINTRF